MGPREKTSKEDEVIRCTVCSVLTSVVPPLTDALSSFYTGETESQGCS